MKYALIGLMFASSVFATSHDLAHMPKSFATGKGKAVFVDFTEATYEITYDMTKSLSSVKARILFNAPEAGMPIFDSVAAPSSINIDGVNVSATETSTPSRETTLRVIDKEITVGAHVLSIELPLSTLVDYKDGGVKSAFWTSDLDSREFLERYMPANFEFDQVKMTFLVKFIGGKTKQIIYTNGVQTQIDSSTVKITYPAYYTSSSIFFHTTTEGSMSELRFSLKSIDGREIPAVVYFSKNSWLSSLEKLKTKTTEVFQELESDYGAFPHPSITVYQAGAGGMEYCGATMTDASALGHEMFHSYFARGVMPANGNSGWLDEALASWRDGGYSSLSSLDGSSGMSSHAYYTRITDPAAYSFGKRFMGFLDGKTQSKGGLRPFMRYMVERHTFAPIFVEEFIQEMNKFYGISFDADFKRYTFSSRKASLDKGPMNPVHRKMSVKELTKFL